jgi:hypothetical protein
MKRRVAIGWKETRLVDPDRISVAMARTVMLEP